MDVNLQEVDVHAHKSQMQEVQLQRLRLFDLFPKIMQFFKRLIKIIKNKLYVGAMKKMDTGRYPYQ